MTWFGIKKMERQLTDGTLTDKQAFYYLMYAYIIMAVSSYLPYQSHRYYTPLFILRAVISIGMLVYTLIKTFRLNSEGSGKDYFKRLWCVCVVTTNKLLLFTLIAIIPLAIIMHLSGYDNSNPDQRDIFNFVFLLVFQAADLLLAVRSFQRLKELDLRKAETATAI